MRNSNIELINAIRENNIDAVKDAIDNRLAQINHHIKLTETSSAETTPTVAAAALRDEPELLKVLLESGADITIRCKNIWRRYDDLKDIVINPNPLDAALQSNHPNSVKLLLSHAAVHLDSDEQLELLKRMREKNVLLYVAKNYRQFMPDMVKEILNRKDDELVQQIMRDFVSSDGVTTKLIDRYLEFFVTKEVFDARRKKLKLAKFDANLDGFKTLPSNQHANRFIKDLKDAKLRFLLDGKEHEFFAAVLDAVERASPALSKQPYWKAAILNFLELFAIILPVIKNQIQFYKTTDMARKLEKLKADIEKLFPQVDIQKLSLQASAPPLEFEPSLAVAVAF